MGVESIELDTVTCAWWRGPCPASSSRAGRRLRLLVVRALARGGIVTAADSTPWWVRWCTRPPPAEPKRKTRGR